MNQTVSRFLVFIGLFGKISNLFADKIQSFQATVIFLQEKSADRLPVSKPLIIRPPQHAPFVYRLGRQIFILKRGVRLP
jgi:hypothetical protein